MKVYLSFIPAFCVALFLITGCASSGKTSTYYGANRDTVTFKGDYNQVVQLAVDAVKDQGLRIDKNYAVNISKYVITAHLSNEYLTSSPYSGNANLPQESAVQVVITYVSDVRTKVLVKEPKIEASGVRNTYRKNINGQIFHYIGEHLQSD